MMNDDTVVLHQLITLRNLPTTTTGYQRLDCTVARISRHKHEGHLPAKTDFGPNCEPSKESDISASLHRSESALQYACAGRRPGTEGISRTIRPNTSVCLEAHAWVVSPV